MGKIFGTRGIREQHRDIGTGKARRNDSVDRSFGLSHGRIDTKYCYVFARHRCFLSVLIKPLRSTTTHIASSPCRPTARLAAVFYRLYGWALTRLPPATGSFEDNIYARN